MIRVLYTAESFQMFDKNGDGVIDFEELNSVGCSASSWLRSSRDLFPVIVIRQQRERLCDCLRRVHQGRLPCHYLYELLFANNSSASRHLFGRMR